MLEAKATLRPTRGGAARRHPSRTESSSLAPRASPSEAAKRDAERRATLLPCVRSLTSSVCLMAWLGVRLGMRPALGTSVLRHS